jgi:hypothetical protein
MGMDVAPDRLEFGLLCEDGFDESHLVLPCMF